VLNILRFIVFSLGCIEILTATSVIEITTRRLNPS
jgi:hypothetical protein